VVENQLAQADIDVRDIPKLGKELSQLGRITTLTDGRNEKLKTIAELLAVEKEEAAKGAEGADMLQLAQEERVGCEAELAEIEGEIVKYMTPKDEADDRGIILEVRAGTGIVVIKLHCISNSNTCCTCNDQAVTRLLCLPVRCSKCTKATLS
jgi:peptide chain release factor 1